MAKKPDKRDDQKRLQRLADAAGDSEPAVHVAASRPPGLAAGQPRQWVVWEDRKCDYCGYVDTTDEPAYRLQCPSCDREGCEECMPAGRGCVCPECENGDNDETGDD